MSWRWIREIEIVTIVGNLVIQQNTVGIGEQETELGKKKDWNMGRIGMMDSKEWLRKEMDII